MNKEQVYKELDEKWNLFKMNDNEIIEAYKIVTGLEPYEEQTILDLKEYLLEFVLEQIMKDEDIDNVMAANVLNEVLEQWK